MTRRRDSIFHRNDHGHRFHTCHHERCYRDGVGRTSTKTLNTDTYRWLVEPRRTTIAQARLA